MVSNDKPLAHEKSHVQDPVKKMKWKSLKRVMKNHKNRVKCSKTSSQIEAEKRTKNSKQNDFKISKKATSSVVSPVTPTKRPTRKRKTIECYLPTSASRVYRNPFTEEEKGHSEVPVKKMNWKSIKMLMKNQKKITKCSKNTSQLQGKKKTQNSKQSDLKILKKARSSVESPVTSTKRSTRKRKTVELYSSLWTSASRAARKPFPHEKGKGTRLKDIPNVAYKLAQSKYDDNVQIPYTILFGKRTKGKHRSKVKERIDKCVKNKLLELCDILDIPISNKSSTKKGDISAKILNFLEFPRATTESSIADKTVKGRKQRGKGQSCRSPALVGATTQRPSKKQNIYGDEENESNDGMSEEENESNDGMSEESDPDAWYNYKYGRHEDVEVDDDLWDTDPDTAWHLYKYGRRVFTTPW